MLSKKEYQNVQERYNNLAWMQEAMHADEQNIDIFYSKAPKRMARYIFGGNLSCINLLKIDTVCLKTLIF